MSESCKQCRKAVLPIDLFSLGVNGWVGVLVVIDEVVHVVQPYLGERPRALIRFAETNVATIRKCRARFGRTETVIVK